MMAFAITFNLLLAVFVVVSYIVAVTKFQADVRTIIFPIVIFLVLSTLSISFASIPKPNYALVAAYDAPQQTKDMAKYVCDGVADQAQINAALALGNSELSVGTFHCSDNVLPVSNRKLEGQGDSTILDFSVQYLYMSNVDNISISNLKVIGTGRVYVNNSALHGGYRFSNITISNNATEYCSFGINAINTTVNDIQYVNCKAVDGGSTGFYLNGSGASALITNVSYTSCYAINCGKVARYSNYAVGFNLTEGVTISGVTVSMCSATGCWENGFYEDDAATKTNVVLNNCIASNNGRDKASPTYGCGFLLSGGTSLNSCSANDNYKGFNVLASVTLNNCSTKTNLHASAFAGGVTNNGFINGD